MLVPAIVFICGVNGVGKSSVIPHLRAILPSTYDIHDFDERGVPENAGSAWRASETAHWLELAHKRHLDTGNVTIICGFVKPVDFGTMQERIGTDILCIYLDASPEVIRARLSQRYTKDGVFDTEQRVIGKSVEEFIAGNIYIRERLKQAFTNLGCPIIDTTELEPEEVAERIKALLKTNV